ncbi:hypothetical protein [Arthrobacter sp. CP30]
MNATTNVAAVVPSGFKIDAGNPQLFWGPKVEAEHYYLHLTWNASTGEAELYTEISDSLPVDAMLNLAVDLAVMAGVVRNLTF